MRVNNNWNGYSAYRCHVIRTCLALAAATSLALSAEQLGHHYIDEKLPAYATAYATALGGELQKGSERLVWRGTLSRAGRTVPFHFTRELDEHVRLDISGAMPKVLTASNLRTASPVFTLSQTKEDEELLETIADDSAESFLLGIQGGATTRYLGGGVNVDGLTCDLYVRRASIDALPERPIRDKLFYFDTGTRLLVMSRYEIADSGGKKNVEVRYRDWVSENGRQRPRTITRSENGTQVLKLNLAVVESSASRDDSLFALPQR